ncbi:zf-HC2 domain-containing protein [Planomonospora corallina]|uniref:Zf-HC2 domain-containing protein n=1 Tax=Planomonospora corallina TaxID=1806052 RepID=A0ABV8IBQ1_9ACTN
MTMSCDEVRMSLGVHALGALDAAEHALVEEHLAGCAGCRAEAEELAGVAGFLGRVSEEDVAQVARPPHSVLDRLLRSRARRRRTARTLLGLAAAAAVIGVGGTVWVTADRSAQDTMTAASAPQSASDATGGDPAAEGSRDAAGSSEAAKSAGPAPEASASVLRTGPPPAAGEDPAVTRKSAPEEARPAPTSSAGSDASVMLDQADEPLVREGGEQGGVRARVSAAPAGQATAVEVVVSGIATGTRFRLDVVAADGSRQTAGNWTVDRAAYDESGPFPGSVTVPPGGIERFELVTAEGRVLLAVPAR